jgi:ribosomal protein S20
LGSTNADVILLPHGNCYTSAMPTTVMENKSRKSLLGTYLQACHHDLTKILGAGSLQIIQFLNTPLSKYEHKRTFMKANSSRVKNRNLFLSIKMALFVKI